MALHSTRVHAHGLTRTTTGLSGHWCDGCRGPLVAESFRCSPCNFDLCSACLGKSKTTVATRVHAHPLTYTTTGLERHFCDLCSAATTRDSWRCSSCNFDACTTCFDTIQAPKPVPAPKPATPPAVEAKATPSVPSHAHPLTRQTIGSGHFCDGCRAAVTDSWRCVPCNWDLCAACYKSSTEVTTRLHSHPVVFTNTGLDGHYCDGCRAGLASSAWRCAACNFDLCDTCFTRSKAPKPTTSTASTSSAADAKDNLRHSAHPLVKTTTGLSGHHCDGCRTTSLTVSYQCKECNYDLCAACYDRNYKTVVSLHPHALNYIQDKGIDTNWCDGCRKTIGTAGAWRCGGCDFDLCLACIDRVKTPKPVPTPAAPSTSSASDNVVLTKAHAHGLTRTTTGLSGHHCDGCRATALTVSYRCNDCNFDLCPTCMGRNRMAQTTRMHAHPLSFTRGLTNHYCDDCRKTVSAAWRCADCNFDLCGICFVRAKEVKPKKVAPKPAVVPPTVVVDSKVEAKVDRVPVKNHSHPLVRTTTNLTGHFCDSCRASPLTEAHRCDDCNFDLCGACLAVNRVEQSSRLHAHPLTFTTGLSAHYCDSCRKSTTEAFRCSGCNYDACVACFESARVPAAPAPTSFWSCNACTYVNTATAAECYICATRRA